ncbi:MAG: hypothetical protein ACRESZ_19535 [Methylococcales bacterium]
MGKDNEASFSKQRRIGEIAWCIEDRVSARHMTDAELVQGLEDLRNLMIAVATGGPRIVEVNDRYQRMFAEVSAELARRRLDNPITFGSLWDWYGRWSSGDLPSYQSRRNFIGELLTPLVNQVRTGRADELPPTGWPRVDRTIGELRDRLAPARNEEQFQTVGLLCREALISVAQVVYVRAKHPPLDKVEPSATDAKRMLEAYIAVELAGGANEEARKHARSALDLANVLQHRRTATFRDAALCVEATTTVVNVVAIVAGRRDPQ